MHCLIRISFQVRKEPRAVLYAEMHFQLIRTETAIFAKQRRKRKVTNSKILMCGKREQYTFGRNAETASAFRSVLAAVLFSITSMQDPVLMRNIIWNIS